MTAVSDTGLQLYKFGKTASIPKWQKSFTPNSFYDILEGNQNMGAHTLLLLDIGLEVGEALGYVWKISAERGDRFNDKKWIVCSRLGMKGQKIVVGKIKDLEKQKFEEPCCLILPGRLHFVEEEFLENFND